MSNDEQTVVSGNVFESIPENLVDEDFTVLLKHGGLKIERIISKGHISPKSGWYDQQQNEWVIVIKGEATLTLECGAEINLKEGAYYNLPAHTKHKVSWTRPDVETIWLAVHY